VRLASLSSQKSLTIMYPLTDALQHMNIDSRSASIVPIVFEFANPDDAFRSLSTRKRESSTSSNSGDRVLSVEGQDCGIYVYVVWVEDLGHRKWWEDRLRKVRRGGEGVFVGTVRYCMIS
jgi:hypothetical protein